MARKFEELEARMSREAIARSDARCTRTEGGHGARRTAGCDAPHAAGDAGTVPVLQRHTKLREQLHLGSDAFLLAGIEPVPPGAELIGELDLTCHPVHIMSWMACRGQGVPSAVPFAGPQSATRKPAAVVLKRVRAPAAIGCGVCPIAAATRSRGSLCR